MKCAGQKQRQDWSIGREDIPETRHEIGVSSRAAVMENEEALVSFHIEIRSGM